MVPVIAIFCIFGLPIVAYIVSKTLAHNERMELIRMQYFYAGYPPAGTAPASAKVVLLPPLAAAAAPGATITPIRTVLDSNRREG
jgi:hypothetical protein